MVYTGIILMFEIEIFIQNLSSVYYRPSLIKRRLKWLKSCESGVESLEVITSYYNNEENK